MKTYLYLAFSLIVTSCYQSTNSNSFDRVHSENPNIDRSTAAGERFYQAYTIIKNNCTSCHTGYHNTWSTFNTDQAWISSGLVESNDAYGSTLVIRLKNIGGNMPKNNPQISEEDFKKITDWIDGI